MNSSETNRAAVGDLAADRAAFVSVAPLYDALMHDVPYHLWTAYLRQILEVRSAQPQRVLDLACGTGNVSERLAAQGYAVTGVDIAPGMIAEAQRKAAARGLAIDYFVQDAAELDLPGRKFDLCVSLFDSLNYVTEPSRLAQTMARVAAHLEPNGLFIFDLNTEFALQNHFFDQDNMKSSDRLRYDWDSEYSARTRLCKVQMRFWYREEDGTEREFEEIHWQYAYRQEEIVAILQAAGFEEIAVYQAYTLNPPSRASDRLYYVARRF